MLSLKNTTHYSILRGYSKVDELVKLAADYGYSSVGITDYGLAGCIEHAAECKKAKVKAVLGTKVNYGGEELTLVAQNKVGWKNLIRLVSRSYDYEERQVLREDLEEFNSNLLCLSKRDSAKEIFGDRYYYDDFRESFYLKKEDAIDHRLILCSKMKTTLNRVHQSKDYPEYAKYFDNNSWFLNEPVPDVRLTEIEARCESYSITGPPILPKFNCPDGLSEKDYLRKLAREGYARRQKSSWNPQVYGDRANMELEVFEKANLSGYFLIVADYVNWCKRQGWIIGPGRGSAGGSLIAYLIGITEVDPIPHDLLFERFYNEGRNTADNIEYPDIDVDFPIENRDDVIGYMSDTYGKKHVSGMSTFGRLQGRGAIKEVLRVHSACDMGMMNMITENIPQESAISDKLEESHESSVIRWTLDNEPDVLKDWCHLDKDGNLVGDYAEYFKQAIRIEGTYKSQGKHASGVVIGAEPLEEICPMITDKNGEKITAFDMEAVKKIGLIKMDLLGLSALSKISKVVHSLRKGF